MACSANFSEVPVINVTSNNIKELWPSLVLALKTSTFVALDTVIFMLLIEKSCRVAPLILLLKELSGLGNRKLLGARSLPDRYTNLCEVAKTRSVLSLGLSCFKLQNVGQSCISKDVSQADTVADTGSQVHVNQWSFTVQTFNVVLLCSEEYTVEPGALKFLVEHGFDFNKQYSAGVTYHRGKEKTDTGGSKSSKAASGPTARQLFEILLWSEVPLVLHNGFLDLVFLYQNFYTDLPPTLQVFLADLAEMFPSGILDTKYAVEFVDRLPATYLEYVFRKWQRRNALQASTERRKVSLEFGRLPANSDHVTYSHCGLPTTCVEMDFIPKAAVLQDLVCLSFAGHGWCNKGKQCPKSHAIDLILDLDGIKAAKGRKRRRKQREVQQERVEDEMEEGDENTSTNSDGSKRVRMNHPIVGSSPQVENSSPLGESDSMDATGDSDRSTNGRQASGAETDFDIITDEYLKTSFQLESSRSGGHRAGFDAFMTGFIMACIISKHTSVEEGLERAVGASIKLSQLTGMDSLKNKIYAMGKDHPMTVSKSNFCSPSRNHRERIQKLKKS